MNNFQVLVQMIIAPKPAFREEANEQLKHQYDHKLCNSCYVAIAHSVLQTSVGMENFTESNGHLAIMFGDCSKLG